MKYHGGALQLQRGGKRSGNNKTIERSCSKPQDTWANAGYLEELAVRLAQPHQAPTALHLLSAQCSVLGFSLSYLVFICHSLTTISLIAPFSIFNYSTSVFHILHFISTFQTSHVGNQYFPLF